MRQRVEHCADCGGSYTIGEWPYCPHGEPYKTKGFEPYLDENISDKPVWITNPGDRNKLMRPHWEKDHIVKVEERGKSDSYYKQLNERRRERAEAEKRARQ